MDHRGQHEVQGITAQRKCLAVLHFHIILRSNAVEALHHSECLLISDDTNLGIILLNQCNTSTVVGFHVIHHEIVDGTVAQHLADILKILREEVNLHSIYQTHLLIINEVRVI